MRTRLIVSLAAALASLSVAAPAALASGGAANHLCATFGDHGVVATSSDVTATFTVTNCSQSKSELVDVNLALRDLAGNRLWLTGTGATRWLAPGESISSSFGGLNLLGAIAPGGTYDLQFIARDFSKLDVITTADTIFSVGA